jgi:hypothetical protein
MKNNFNCSFWLQEKHISSFGNHPNIEELTKLQFYSDSISFSIDNEFIYGLGLKDIFQYNLTDFNIQTFHLPMKIEKTSILLSKKKTLFLIEIIEEIQRIYQFDTGMPMISLNFKKANCLHSLLNLMNVTVLVKSFHFQKMKSSCLGVRKYFNSRLVILILLRPCLEKKCWRIAGDLQLDEPLMFYSIYYDDDGCFIVHSSDEETSKIYYSPTISPFHFSELIVHQNLKVCSLEEIKIIWDEEHTKMVEFKNKLIGDCIKREFKKFCENPSEETISGCIFLKHSRQVMKDFPLYQSLDEKKFPKSHTKHSIDELYFMLPSLIPELDKSFKSEVGESIQNGLTDLYCQLIQIPNEINIKEKIKQKLENLKSEPVSLEDQSLIDAFMNVDKPFDVYQTIKSTETMKDLPQRYINVLEIFRERSLEFLRMDRFSDNLIDKLKWINRLLFVLTPFWKALNPFTFVEKIIDYVIFSKLGKSGMIMMLDVGKTERMLAHHLKISKELKFNKFIEEIPNKELSEIIEKYHIHEMLVDLTGFQDFLALMFEREFPDKDEVLNCLEVIRLKKRFNDKKGFISMIENPNVEKLLKTVLKISLSAFANLYSNTDVSKIVTLVHHIISSVLSYSEKLKHLPPNQRQEEWNQNVQEIIKNSEEEFFLFCHQLVVKDEMNQKIFLRTVGWISAMMNILGDSTLDINSIFEKDENEIQEFEKRIKIILNV